MDQNVQPCSGSDNYKGVINDGECRCMGIQSNNT